MMLRRIFPFFILIFITSCVKDVDFDQAENLSISPVLESSLIYFNFDAPRFQTNDGTENVVEGDTFEMDIFNDDFARDNLVKAEMFFEVKNSINRRFQAEVQFLDADDQVVHTFTINVIPNGNTEVVTTHTEIFENETLNQLKNTVKMGLTLTMFADASGVSLDENSPGTIQMRSKATLFLEIDTQ